MLNDKNNDSIPYDLMVIDDHRGQLKRMKNRLLQMGCRVFTTDSAEEAMQIIQWGQRFSIIITDLNMPWLNGLQFCKRIKAHHPEMKVFALSANIDSFDMEELERTGFDGIYQKPISDNLLKQILESSNPGSV